jgi:transposase
VNANQLFNWRKQYPDGRLGVNGRECALLPVTVNEASDGGAPNRQHLHLLHRP